MIKNVILILGMHRSGTSAITRAFNLLGAALPKTLLGANEGNARGHWESQKIIDAHNAMLNALGSDWTDYRTLGGMIGTRARKSYVDAMADMIEAEYGGSRADTIVIKEPRICRFTPLYLDAIKAVGASVHVILPSRNPLEVMASLQSRDGMPAQDTMFLWLTHMLEAEVGSRGVSRSFVDYADFLDDPIGACQRIIKDLPFKLPFTLKTATPQITAFVNPGLKRESARPEDVTQHPLAGGWTADSYQALLMLSGAPKSKPALAALDRVRTAYYPAIDMMRAVQKDYDNQLAAKDAALSKCGDDMSALAAQHDEKWKAAEAETEAALKAAKEKTESDIQDLIKDYESSYAAEKDAAQARLNALRTEFTAQIDTLEAERAFMQNEFAGIVSDFEKALADKEAALADAYHSLHETEQHLQSVLGSSSWRMTRSLRAAVNMLRGNRGPQTKALREPQIPPRITHDD